MLGHHALIYSSPEEFLSAAVDYVRRGVEQGDTVVVATPRSAELTAALGTLGTGIEVVDDRRWHHIPAWTIGVYARRAERSARRGGRFRALAELRWHANGDAPAADTEWERYEALLNTALVGKPVELCCAYDSTAVGDGLLDTARRTHPSLLAPDGTRDSTSYVDSGQFLAGHPPPPRLPVPDGALRLEFDAAGTPTVRQTTLRWARAAGMAEDNAQELLIAVYEIVSNAVEHGGGRGIGWLWSDGARLICAVWSAREIADPMAGYRPPGTAQERGRGLWLARQICEQVSIYNSDGATVQLIRSISG